MITSAAFRSLLPLLLCILSLGASATHQSLVVIEDHGGSPARPYYDGLDLPEHPGATRGALPPATTRAPPDRRYTEADILPVRSDRLSPGVVQQRSAQLAGLTQPIFLIGDDDLSRQWLQRRLPELRRLNAVGLVVEVQDAEALHALRRLAPGVSLSPASGDDLAQRLHLKHYPVLVTPTGIEQ